MIIICLHNYLTILGLYKHQKFKNFTYLRKKNIQQFPSMSYKYYIVPIFYDPEPAQVKIPL